ncbi:MAG: hypothetical protein K0R59_2006 [Sphingobacterium sp.]|jgi:hypothetical protein|nr:hypothetical protein [Sphingobacterium sp.]
MNLCLIRVIIIAVILINNLTFSQTKVIKFIDRQSGSALNGVNIQLWSDSTQIELFKTNSSGRVIILDKLARTPFNLKASYIGFVPVDTILEFKEEKEIILQLLPNPIAIDEVNVEGKKEFIQEKNGNFKVNVQTSALAKVSNAWDFLKYAPTVESRFDGTLRIDGKGTTVFVNNRQIFLTGNKLKEFLERMPTSNIESIEVVPNPGLRYGSGVASMISIKTIDMKYEGIKGNVNLRGTHGEYARYNSDLVLDIKKRSITSQIGYNYSSGRILDKSTISTSGVVKELPWNISQSNLSKENAHMIYGNIGVDFSENSKLSGYIEFKPSNKTNKLEGDNGTYDVKRESLGDSIWQNKNLLVNDSHTLFSQLNYDLKWDSAKQNVNLILGFTKNNGKSTINNDYLYYNQGNLLQREPYYQAKIKRNMDALLLSGNYTRNLLGGVISSGARFSLTKLGNLNMGTNYNNIERTDLLDIISDFNFLYRENSYGIFTSWQKQTATWYIGIEALIEGNRVTSQNEDNVKKEIYDRMTLFPSLYLYKKINGENNLSFSYNTQLSRPDYELLNPFLRVTDNTTVIFNGNETIKPAIFHYLSLRWSHRKKFNFSMGVNLQKDVISTFLVEKNNQLVRQYDNFDGAYYFLNANSNFQLFPFWSLTLFAQASTIDVKMYNDIPLGKRTINIFGSMTNDFVLPKSWVISLGIEASTKRGDRYFTYKGYNNVSLMIAKEIKKPGISVFVKASDIFRGQVSGFRSLYIPYREGGYADSRTVAIGASYGFGKKTVKSKDVQKDYILKKSIDRIN